MKKLTDFLERLLEAGGAKKDIALLIAGGAALALSLTGAVDLPFDIAWVAVILCGLPIVAEAFIGLVTVFDIKADVLVSLALIASICIGEIFAAAEVAFIMQLGSLLEELTVARARAGIERLVHLTPQTARLICEDGERLVPADEVEVGQLLRVLPGETVPVDGVIVSGQTSINQAVMTGESLPADKTVGDEVSSGTVNQFGAFDMRALKASEDSSIRRLIRLVQSADAGKAKIVGLADRWATWIVVIALTAAAVTWAITGEIIRAVTILVVFCPCALVLATPTAIMAAIGNATKHGFLVREGDALERLATVSHIGFDKTGTLTRGTPQVVCTESLSGDAEELYRLCAAAEHLSEHPLGKAIVRSYKSDRGSSLPSASDFRMLPGRGVAASVDGRSILAGSVKLLSESVGKIPEQLSEKAQAQLDMGCTVIYIALDGETAGFIALSDTMRDSSADMIRRILALSITPVLLTGDNTGAAETVARGLGIENVHAGCLPEDKLDIIGALQAEGKAVCMVGDGINDAPALKKADIGIAMGGAGSDIAADAADIVLIDDEVAELPHLLALSKRMMRTIKLNLSFSMTLNFVAIILAIASVLDPVTGALVHNAGSVLVIINSALLLKWREKEW